MNISNKRMRTVIGAGFLAASMSGAWAQHATSSGVTLYGALDIAVESFTNAAGESGWGNPRMPSVTGGFMASRWGIRGQEDLGGGLRAVFVMEAGFAPARGTTQQAGRGMGRQTYLGFSSDQWGTLTFGRQWSMMVYSLGDSDVIGPAVMAFGTLDYYLANSRIDNSIVYLGRFGAVTLGATYSFGRDTLNIPGHPGATGCDQEWGDSKACREMSALLKYNTPQWGVAFGIDRIYGGPVAQFGLDSANKHDTRMTLNGFYRLGSVKVGGGVITRNNNGNPVQPRSDLYFAGVSYTVTPKVILDAQIGHLKFKRSPTGDKASTGIIRASYHATKRTAFYTLLGRTNNGGTLAIPVSGGDAGGGPLPGQGQTGLAIGIKHTF